MHWTIKIPQGNCYVFNLQCPTQAYDPMFVLPLTALFKTAYLKEMGSELEIELSW